MQLKSMRFASSKTVIHTTSALYFKTSKAWHFYTVNKEVKTLLRLSNYPSTIYNTVSNVTGEINPNIYLHAFKKDTDKWPALRSGALKTAKKHETGCFKGLERGLVCFRTANDPHSGASQIKPVIQWLNLTYTHE